MDRSTCCYPRCAASNESLAAPPAPRLRYLQSLIQLARIHVEPLRAEHPPTRSAAERRPQRRPAPPLASASSTPLRAAADPHCLTRYSFGQRTSLQPSCRFELPPTLPR